jgi:BirA family transcriptional regulator, biotin operon repressor / biotin---[acetyl-CoA-carboxylase] ligase
VELREFREELPSTQAEAIRRARNGAPEGTRIVARRQSEGRGRDGHRWASPEGNLHFSLILRAPAEHRTLLPLAIGARLRSALERQYQARSVLKWPNDLLVLGKGPPRKLAGILVDAVPSPTLGTAAVVGIGVNVGARAEEYPAELRPRVVSLAELSRSKPPLGEVEELTAAAVESAARDLAGPVGATGILAECRAALYAVGRRATVDSTFSGVIRALGEEGELWLDTPTGPVAVRSGDLVVEET